MKPEIITCIYTNLYGTRLNGRVGREVSYMYSLSSIAETKANILCYTGENDRHNIEEYLIHYKKHKNILLNNFELTSTQLHKSVERIKNIHPKYYTEQSWLNRCVEIMYGKFYWMKENFKHLSDDDYLFWFDAGLSHGGIIPRKYTNKFIEEKDYPEVIHNKFFKDFEYQNEQLFTKFFYSQLKKYTGEQISLVCANNVQHIESKELIPNSIGLHPIGGIFGGKKKILEPFVDDCIQRAEELISKNILVKEEVIMEMMLVESSDKNIFNIFSFDTWYHEDWGPQYKTTNNFCNFFQEVLNYGI